MSPICRETGARVESLFTSELEAHHEERIHVQCTARRNLTESNSSRLDDRRRLTRDRSKIVDQASPHAA